MDRFTRMKAVAETQTQKEMREKQAMIVKVGCSGVILGFLCGVAAREVIGWKRGNRTVKKK